MFDFMIIYDIYKISKSENGTLRDLSSHKSESKENNNKFQSQNLYGSFNIAYGHSF